MTTAALKACQDLADSIMMTVATLTMLPDEEVAEGSDHVCAQGKDVWALITNDIDHERIHVGQVLDARYETRLTQDRLRRLVGDWLAERARLMASLVGLSDEQFRSETAPGQWTYERIVRHVIAVERDSLRSIVEARDAR